MILPSRRTDSLHHARLPTVRVSSGDTSSSAPEGFATLERVLRQRMVDEEQESAWKEVEGCWVLYPEN